MKLFKSASTLLFIIAATVLFSTSFGWNPVVVCTVLTIASFIPMPKNIDVVGINIARVNNAASQMYKNYEGDRRGQRYVGFGDEFVDLGNKAQDFGQEMATGRVFAITIANGSGAQQKVYFVTPNPSFVPTDATRIIRDGAIPTGAAIATLIGSGSPDTIASWLAFMQNNPSRSVGFQVSSTSAAQLGVIMNIVPRSPYSNLQNELIPLGAFRNEYAFNDKILTMRKQIQFDNQTEISVDIPAGATTTFTFYMGAILNTAKALNDKAMIANANLLQ